MSPQLVSVTVEETHQRIVLNRPEKRNVINMKMLDSLLDAIKQAKDEFIRVVSIRGQGEAFSAGADLSMVAAWLADDRWDRVFQFIKRGQEVITQLADLSVPTVAAINGTALGGGCELALACDLRIATKQAICGFPEITLGAVPSWGGTQRLPEVVGQATAKELLLTGRRVDASEAQQLGLVTQVVATDALLDTVKGYASRIASHPPAAVEQLLTILNSDAAATTELAQEMQSMVMTSADEAARKRIIHAATELASGQFNYDNESQL